MLALLKLEDGSVIRLLLDEENVRRMALEMRGFCHERNIPAGPLNRPDAIRLLDIASRNNPADPVPLYRTMAAIVETEA